MSSSTKSISSCSEDDNDQLRRGPWTLQEDNLLIQFIAHHGEGRWNLLAKLSGLRRTGKSCRLRWLNYLKPDVKRGNLSAQEQLLILDLHSKWGNRWSKIAQYLPGRTDNEIKNYWRTRVQKQARHLKIDTNSEAFRAIIRCYWIPRLLQKIEESSSPPPPPPPLSSPSAPVLSQSSVDSQTPAPPPPPPPQVPLPGLFHINEDKNSGKDYLTSSCDSSSQLTQISDYPILNNYGTYVNEWHQIDNNGYAMEIFNSATCHMAESNWMDNDFAGYMSNVEELWQFKN